MRSLLLLAVVFGCSASNPGFNPDTDGPPAKLDGPRTDVDPADADPPAGADLLQVTADAVDLGEADLVNTTAEDGGTDLLSTASPDLLPATCALPGACSPGSQETTDCQVRTCGNDCKWGSWGLKAGYQCCASWTQGCNAGVNCASQGKQSCTGAFQWGACVCP